MVFLPIIGYKSLFSLCRIDVTFDCAASDSIILFKPKVNDSKTSLHSLNKKLGFEQIFRMRAYTGTASSLSIMRQKFDVLKNNLLMWKLNGAINNSFWCIIYEVR